MRRLHWSASFVALAHAVVVYWHGAHNIFRMALRELTVPFRFSAVLPLILELSGRWVSIRILRHSSPLIEP